MSIRLFLSQKIESNNTITLSKYHSHYLQKVMRCRVGDSIFVFNEVDGEWKSYISEFSKSGCVISVNLKIKEPFKPKQLFLAYAPTKQGCSLVVSQATELGVTDIIPVITERTIVRKVNIEKLRQNVIEAVEQCERLDVPNVHDITDLNGLLSSCLFKGNLLFCNERCELKSTALSLSDYGHCILVGPEGGFTDREKKDIESFPRSTSISMGKRILKAGTAIVASLSMYHSIYGKWE
jgi:16S rRNA (uracil1498-N3)-methyltransferase